MIDIHCHILPGIDDGAKNMEQSLAMAQMALEYGVDAIVCTPHVYERPENKLTRERIWKAVEELRESLKENGIKMKIHIGGEYYLDQPFPLLLQKHHPLAYINDTNYVMVEFPMLNLPPYLEFSTLDSELEDPELKKLLPFLRIILAHPERNAEIARNLPQADRLKDMGIIFQVNMGSLAGFYGRLIRKTAERLLKKGMVDLIATDAHSENMMKKIFEAAKKRIIKLTGERGWRLLCEDNPQRVIQGEEIEQL
jgi:protein-tyrosine phosphatase